MDLDTHRIQYTKELYLDVFPKQLELFDVHESFMTFKCGAM
jgi:hypothetical protein